MKTLVFSIIALAALNSHAMIVEACAPNLTLECKADYTNDINQVVLSRQSLSTFADENWDEPSLQNCASTVYITIEDGPLMTTTVRVYAQKDLNSQNLQISAAASQVVDTLRNGEVVRRGFYSNENDAATTVGHEADMGQLILPIQVQSASETVTAINVICNSHY